MKDHRAGVRAGAGLAACCFSMIAGSCGLEKSYPVKDTFVLRAGESSPVARVSPEVLRVESVRVAPPYGERNLVFRTGEVTMSPDYYNVFVANPEDLLTGELTRMLSESKAFSAVVEPGSVATATLRLDCTVTDLYADVRDKAKPAALCRARYRLLREETGRTVVAGEWTFEKSAAIASDSGEAAARGMGQAFGMTVDSFVKEATR